MSARDQGDGGRTARSTQQFAEADLLFHQAIADASGNALLNVVSGVINDSS